MQHNNKTQISLCYGEIMEATEIQKYYKNKTVLITGATGFLGTVLVEKLLRTCSELNKIILPVRPKKNVKFERRVADYFNNRLFDTIKSENPEVLNKVMFVNSDIKLYKCGLNTSDYNYVISSVNIIFHSAAMISFNGPLSEAVAINIKATKYIINIAKNMTNLEALVHVSTTWSHGITDYTEEKVHNLTYDAEFLINLVDNIEENTLRKITPYILDGWPNTYVFTKHVSEVLIAAEKDHLPVEIFRAPGIVPIYREPVPAWINNLQAISIYGAGIASGSIKIIYCDPEYNIHIVPADLIINCMISVAWNKAMQNENVEFKVYNYSCVTNPLLRKRCYESFLNTKYPLENIMSNPGYVITNSKWLFDKYVLLFHNIPGYISEKFFKIFNQNFKYKKTIERNNLLVFVSAYFFLGDLKLEFKNTPALWNKLSLEDKQLFNFDVNSINWDEYLDIFNRSIKEQLKEDFSRMDQCEAKRYLFRNKY